MTELINATFHYRCIYAAEGIIDPDPGLDYKLLQNTNVEVRLLGSDAYRNLVGLIVSPEEKELTGDYRGLAREKLERRRNGLIHQVDRHAVVCVESRLSADVVKGYSAGYGDLPAYTRSPLKQNAERAFKAVSAAIALARSGHLSKNYDFVHEQYFITDHQSRVIGSLRPASAFDKGPMSKLSMAEIQAAEELTPALYGDVEMNRVLDVYSDSLTPYKGGHLHAFIAAWTALEMFIAKQFKEIQSRVTISINGAEAHKDFSGRVMSVMTDKYRLVDKFAALCSYYGDVDADKDVEELKNIKKIRDEYFHSMKGEVAGLPLTRTRLLISKYLQIYLERNQLSFALQRSS